MQTIKNLKLKIYNFKSVLVLILIWSAVLRIWNLGTIPPSLTPDEAALGYNAYSILHTGKDEYGKTLPVIFKSFGDYKPGFYVYLTTPMVSLFGLNEFSVRLPSALFGILSVYLIYLITNLLFKDRKLSMISAFVAALNPYLIYFSRGAWEANVSLSLTLLGIYLFLKSFDDSKLLLFSAVSFALTLLTYQGAKLSTAIVLVLLVLIYWKRFWSLNVKSLIFSGVLGLIISTPIILSLFNGQAERLTVFSIFSYRRPPEVTNQILGEGSEKVGDLNYNLFHTENLNYARGILSRYFNTLSGKFLFFEGDTANPVHTAPYQGVLLLADIIFLPLGFFAIYKKKLGMGELFFISWFILAPISSAISRDQTNAVRSLNMAVPAVVIISFGLTEFSRLLKTHIGAIAASTVIFALYLLSFTYFADAYYIHVPAHNSEYWRYGYEEAFQYIISNGQKYGSIVFEQSFNQPYIYYLFYGPKDPAKHQNQEKLVSSQYAHDVGFIERIDNINFQKIDWEVLKKEPGTLVIASPVSFPPNFEKDAKLIKEIKYLNGRDVAFDIVEMK